jgi:DNA topoisomerase VI subunit B
MASRQDPDDLRWRHIINNLSIFGFGTSESALLQCVKELVENSIDSIKATLPENNSRIATERFIAITINHVDGNPTLCLLQVSDNGSGMARPSKLLQAYYSTKSSSDQSEKLTSGRFGVGLSVCMAYSLFKTRNCLRVVTKQKESEWTTVADFALNERNQVYTLKELTVKSALSSGTVQYKINQLGNTDTALLV